MLKVYNSIIIMIIIIIFSPVCNNIMEFSVLIEPCSSSKSMSICCEDKILYYKLYCSGMLLYKSDVCSEVVCSCIITNSNTANSGYA